MNSWRAAASSGILSTMYPRLATSILVSGLVTLALASSSHAQQPRSVPDWISPHQAFAPADVPRVETAAAVRASDSDAVDVPYNSAVLDAIRAMPRQGGYSADHAATMLLSGAVTLGGPGGLAINPERARPSYCSGATYLVFLKAVDALAQRGAVPDDGRMFASLLISGQRDGEGVWGRWNANGPGTARLFYQLGVGRNFSDFAGARAGDFMKIWWSQAVGRREHGHSVIFLDQEDVQGVPSVRFWSSNLGVGYSEKVVPRAKIAAAFFSRLTDPGRLVNAPALSPVVDPYLGSLLSKDSSLVEAQRLCGM